MEVLCQSSLNNCSRHDVWISGVVNYRLLCITGVVMMFAMLVFVRGDRGVLLVPTRNSCSDHAMTALVEFLFEVVDGQRLSASAFCR